MWKELEENEMIEECATKTITYSISRPVEDEDDTWEEEIFSIQNDFDGENQFKLEVEKPFISLDELKQVKKIVDKAIREVNKEF